MSVMFFLNSLIPFPNEAAISGMRFAPNSRRKTIMMRRISVKPRLPNMVTTSEEGPGDQIGDDHAHEAHERDVQRHRANGEMNDNQVDVDRAQRGRHPRREELLHRAGGEEGAADLRK